MFVPGRALESRGCRFPELLGVRGTPGFLSLQGVLKESLEDVGTWQPSACFSSELDPKSKADFFGVLFVSLKDVRDSRKSLRLGDLEGALVNPDGADLVDFGVMLPLLVPSLTFSTSVLRAGRLEPPCWSLALLKIDEVRSFGLELGAGVDAGF